MGWLYFSESNLKAEVCVGVGHISVWRNYAIASIAVIATGVAITPSSACAVSDFEIIQADWRITNKELHFVTMVGEIKSNCVTPMGAEIQVVFRDSAGKVVVTKEFYPKRSRDLQPGEICAFTNEFLADDLEKNFATASVKVIGTYRWGK
ncbi:MAG: hypothetical protein J0H78_10750 [Rhizobiales bacterium]|nr:hypothetical protein [Hyphomicrobiales bacterium]OJY46451.1 MAG: hypothetical protein BGP08_15440 [Rhizobiales bacterium 64-17]